MCMSGIMYEHNNLKYTISINLTEDVQARFGAE